MKSMRYPWVPLSILLLLGAGCTTTSLRVRGTDGAMFRAEIENGPVITTMAGQGPGIVYETDRAAFTCDIHKMEKSSMIEAEVRRGNRSVFRFTAPPGTCGMRLVVDKGTFEATHLDAP